MNLQEALPFICICFFPFFSSIIEFDELNRKFRLKVLFLKVLIHYTLRKPLLLDEPH